MKHLVKLRRCRRMPRNVRGRDFVVGDLHGHRALLEAELDRLAFDPECDRLLSVGDLINRGPDSLATLSLIEESWFHAVLGNHELMLLSFLGYYGSRLHSRRSFIAGGGEWISRAMSRHPKAVARLAEQVTQLPVALHVECEIPFNVTHGDLHPIGSSQDGLLGQKSIGVHKADCLAASRINIGTALKSELLGLQFAKLPVRISTSPLVDLPITYVGHSPHPHITVHNSHVYIDQRVGASVQGGPDAVPPTVLEHQRFARWLEGVVTAQR